MSAWLPRLGVRMRLLVLTGLVLAGFAALLGMVVIHVREGQVGGPIDVAVDAHGGIRYRLAMLKADLNEVRRMAATALSLTSPADLEALRQRSRAQAAVVKLQFHEVLGMAVEEPVRVALADANVILEEVARANEAMLEALQAGRRRSLGALIEMQALRQERFMAQVDSVLDTLAVREQELQTEVRRAVTDRLSMVLLSGLALSIFVGILTFWVARSITAPLQTLVAASHGMAAGDLTQRVGVAGGGELREVSTAFNEMAERVQALQGALTTRIAELERTLSEVKQLQGLLPICAYCKKVRDDENYWHQVDGYLATHLDVKFTHGVCPACRESVMKGLERTSS